MALQDSETTRTEKPPEASKPNDRREKPLTKVVIRRLPPSISMESLLHQVSPIPEYNYIYLVKGDMSLGENSFSRVYINFCNPDDIYAFKEKFDNYVFVDTKGHEYAAVVEYAAFQKVPKRRGKPRSDPKCGTIETDNVYLEFVESLKSQPNKEEKPEFSYQPSSENKNDNSTPLLDYIKQRRIDRQRMRDEKKEERRKKEFERKKIKEDERRKHYEEKSPNKASKAASSSKQEESKDKAEEKQDDKTSPSDKNDPNFDKSVNTLTYRNRKFEDRKPSGYKSKSKYNARDDYYDRRESYKNRREDKEKDYKKKSYEESKKEVAKAGNKKIKKYSERREEMKAKQTVNKQSDTKENEKGEAKDCSNQEEIKDVPKKPDDNDRFDEEDHRTKCSDDSCESMMKDEKKQDVFERGDSAEMKSCEKESRHRNKENDPRLQRRIRNKDRPTMAIYQPGMLRKKGDEPEPEPKPTKCASSSDKE